MSDPAARRLDPGAVARGMAAAAVAQVLASGMTLEEALASAARSHGLPAEQPQPMALAFGALRWHHRHRVILRELLERPLPGNDRLIEALLSVGLFQLTDERQPAYAVVSATVDAARWLGRPRFAALVNAALRRFQREREPIISCVLASEEGRYSHPPWLIERLRSDWPGDWHTVLEAAQAAPPLWLRVNRLRTGMDAYQTQLRAETGQEAWRLDGFDAALRLAKPLPVERIPGFAEGRVSIQDAASQLAAGLLGAEPGMRVLDACAAPGGKATHILECAGGDIGLVALDIAADRLKRVRENLQRLGLQAHLLTGDACQPDQWWDGAPFDRILVDAPCSGTGVIRRHPDIKFLRRAGDIAPLAARQLQMLQRLWPLLRPGGRLLYATCSVLRAENGAVIQAFLASQPDARIAESAMDALPGWVSRGPEGGAQLLPGATDTDGLYYALMTRQSA
jgi:16S rRNA (cytosine967-C5)-methyltransferase